jgi:Zn-dependent protease
MRWSWRIARLAGIGVYIHVTFLLLVIWVVVSSYLPHRSWLDAVDGTIFILLIFGCVVLHELGHALAARRFGIRTRDITLLPIGGVARLERMPEQPRQELVVALAGPAVNVGLAAALLGLWVLQGLPLPAIDPEGMVRGSLVPRLLAVNLILAVFNLIPAFPMDGGRVLRALLALRLDHVRATEIAAHVGQGLALLLGFLGLFTNPFLVFIALFVWMGAAAESSMVQMRSALAGIPVRHAMVTHFRTLRPEAPLGEAIQYVLAGFQQDFPVEGPSGVVGVLRREDLLRTLAERGHQTLVGEAMTTEFAVADPSEMLEAALRRQEASPCKTLPVLADGLLVGLLTPGNVGELLSIRSAVGRRRH